MIYVALHRMHTHLECVCDNFSSTFNTVPTVVPVHDDLLIVHELFESLQLSLEYRTISSPSHKSRGKALQRSLDSLTDIIDWSSLSS